MTEITPEDFIKAVLAIVADPAAAKRRADEMAALNALKNDLDKRQAEQNAREKTLAGHDADTRRGQAEIRLAQDRLTAQEAALASRAKELAAGENKLQGKIVAQGQDANRVSAELNTREQNVAKRERELDKAEKKVAEDRALLDKKLAKAREFVDAA
jgi:chromosome segregation ATPase